METNFCIPRGYHLVFFVLQYCELSEISIVLGNRNMFDSELTMLLKEMCNFFVSVLSYY